MATAEIATSTEMPNFAEPTPTLPLADLVEFFIAQVRRERDLLLALVDERERLLIEMGCISPPRTAEIRKWWKEQQR